ncbi:hypothetical protein B7494_g2474 [Chlorociboria aeruginascens]|nr:hypothetical protein B7494_g2474 [Chlorociboria aeruginascens]
MSRLAPLPLPQGITATYLNSHDLTYHLLQSGTPRKSPLVLLLHGFPELAYSWRKVMPSIASQGYYVVAYDQRGYGRTSGWDNREYSSVDLKSFTFTNLVRDAVVLVNALGTIIMSHPFKGSPSLPFDILSPTYKPPPKYNLVKHLAALSPPRKHYRDYYSTPSAAREMDYPPESLSDFLRGYFHLKSADWDGNHPAPLKEWNAEQLSLLPHYYVMPLHSTMRDVVTSSLSSQAISSLSTSWLPQSDLAIYVEDFARNGFQGGLNWYRVSTDAENMKDMELFAGRKIEVPCLFVSGSKDWGMYQEPGVVEKMGEVCTKFMGVQVVEGAGHWIQQEKPERVVYIVEKFLQDVKADAISY